MEILYGQQNEAYGTPTTASVQVSATATTAFASVTNTATGVTTITQSTLPTATVSTATVTNTQMTTTTPASVSRVQQLLAANAILGASRALAVSLLISQGAILAATPIYGWIGIGILVGVVLGTMVLQEYINE